MTVASTSTSLTTNKKWYYLAGEKKLDDGIMRMQKKMTKYIKKKNLSPYEWNKLGKKTVKISRLEIYAEKNPKLLIRNHPNKKNAFQEVMI